jgi:hypothetical protein
MTDRAIAWLKMATRSGAVAAWMDGGQLGKPYPEVTAYLIPTLLKVGEEWMANASAEYILAIQRADGALPGLDGLSRTFDTAACYEGLMAAFKHFGGARYVEGATRARHWLMKMGREDGALKIAPSIEDTRCYTCRADGLLRRDRGLLYWTPDADWSPKWGTRERVHYIAYCLEGLWRGGPKEPVIRVLKASQNAIREDGLMPFYIHEGWLAGEGTCLTATAQMAMLYRWAGMDASRLMAGLEKARHPSGGFPVSASDSLCVSWPVKFYLDAVLAEVH